MGRRDRFALAKASLKKEKGQCRIRTHVPGSEGRKDIQTTPIAQYLCESSSLLKTALDLAGARAMNSPCFSHDCSLCCRDTIMPITNAEAKKLQRQTGLQLEAFSYVDNEGFEGCSTTATQKPVYSWL